MTLRLILGCGLLEFKSEDGEQQPGAARLYRILISESSYLIWKLWCERVIKHDDPENDWHPAQEVKKRWLYTINMRLKLDQAMTSVRFHKKALKRKMVLETWRPVLNNANDLPKDWIGRPGVLVGKPQSRAGRNLSSRGDG